MRTFFFFFLFSLVSSLGAKEYKVKFGPDGLPQQSYWLDITFNVFGKLADGGTMTLRNTGSEILFSGSKSQTWSSRTNEPQVDGGYLKSYQVADTTLAVPTRTYTMDISTSWTGGQSNQTQFADIFTRENVATNRVGAVQTIRLKRTIVIYGPGLVTAQYNLIINTRSRPVAGVDYLVKWEDETARSWSVPASNPPSSASSLFPAIKTTTEPAVPISLKIWRRVQGFDTWVPMADTTCNPGQTIVFNDYPEEPPEELPDDPENPDAHTPPDVANNVTSTGAQTGTQTSTSGNGMTPPAGSGGSGGSGGTGGTGGDGGDGGDGEGLTQAEVQQAVREGVKQAANDSTGNGNVGLNMDGVGEEVDIQEDVDNLDEKRGQLGEAKTTLKGMSSSLGAHFTDVHLPGSVGTGSLTRSVTLPVLGAMQIDFTPYSSTIDVFRMLILAIVALLFALWNIRIVRSAIG